MPVDINPALLPVLFGKLVSLGPTFIGKVNLTFSNGGNVTFPAGTVTGDVALIQVNSAANGGAVSASGYTQEIIGVSGTKQNNVFYKILSPADIATPGTWSGTNASGMVSVYRGARTITLKSEGSSITTSLTVPSIRKSRASIGLVSLCGSYLAPGSPGAPTAPSNWSADGTESTTDGACAVASIAPSGYPNDTTIAWTSLLNTASHGAALFELT